MLAAAPQRPFSRFDSLHSLPRLPSFHLAPWRGRHKCPPRYFVTVRIAAIRDARAGVRLGPKISTRVLVSLWISWGQVRQQRGRHLTGYHRTLVKRPS